MKINDDKIIKIIFIMIIITLFLIAILLLTVGGLLGYGIVFAAEHPYNPQPGDSLVCYVVTWGLTECDDYFKTIEWVNPDSMTADRLEVILKPDTIWAEYGRFRGTFKPSNWNKKLWRKY